MNFILNLLTEADNPASSSTTANDGSGIWMWVILGVLIVGLFVFNYFSRKKQQKAAEEKMAGLVPGSKIKTIGLICGTVISIDDVQNTVVIETGDNENKSYLTIDKSAIYQIFPEGSGVNGVNAFASSDEQSYPVEEVPDDADDIDETSEIEDDIDEENDNDAFADIDEIADIDEEKNGENN